MTDPVPERPILSANSVNDLIRGLLQVLSSHAVRSNRTTPKDGSELIDQESYSVRTIPEITANQNDWDVGKDKTMIRVSSDALRFITGIANGNVLAPGEGRAITLMNSGATNTIVLLEDDVNSAAENRMFLGAGVALLPNESVQLFWDITSNRWRRKATH